MNLKLTSKKWLQLILFALVVRWSVQECILLDEDDMDGYSSGIAIKCFNVTNLTHEMTPLLHNTYHMNSIIWKVTGRNSKFDTFHKEYFGKVDIFEMDITNCDINTIGERAFEGANVDYLVLKGNGIKSIQGYAFNSSKIVSLNLSNNSLSTIKADVFKGMLLLKHLYLSYNNIHSIEGLENLPRLTNLYLSHNPISIRNLYNTTYLVNLRTLDLNHNALTDVGTPLAYLTSLENLHLQDNLLEKMDCADFENKTNLSDISLSMNSITTIDNINKCPPSIENLNLSDNSLARMGSLSNLKNLMSLDLSGNALTVIHYSMLQNLTHLEYLDLSRNYIKTLHLGCFRDLVSLTELRLHLNTLSNLTHGVFGGLNHLTLLDLSSNELKNFDADIIVSITHIDSLDISNNQLKNFDLNRLLEHMTHLNYFKLEGNYWDCSYLAGLMTKFKFIRFVEGSVLDAMNVRGIKCEVNTRTKNGIQEISSLAEASHENVASKLNAIISLLVLLLLAVIGNLLYKLFKNYFTSSVLPSVKFKNRNKEELQLII